MVDRTTPQTTVASYLQALGAGRGDLASTMLSPEARADGLDASWRADAPDLTNVAVGAPRDVGGELPYWESQYAEVQEVQVSFFLADSSGKDGFFGGDTWWGYRVVRSPADQPWMI